MASPAAVLSILVQAKGIQETSRRLKQLDDTAKRSAASTENLDRKFSNLDNTVGDFNRSMTGVRNVVSLVKFPAMIAGAGAAAQAMGALAAGAVAAGAALAPLSGAGAAVAVGYTAMGQAAGVAKLATMGLGDAINGQKGAMDKLSPVQRDFVKQIRGLKDETQSLRGQAQRGLLPGLSDGLKSVMPLIDRLTPIVRDTADAMGGLARRAGELAASWGSDLTTVGRANVKIIGNVGDAALSAANAARNLIAAASPLAVWLSQLAARGAKWVSIQISAARQAGTLNRFFTETGSVIGQLIQIAQNLGRAFFNIGKAAAPLGRQLLQDLTLLTARFRAWTESASGENKIAAYFKAAEGPLYTIFGLIGDVGAAILRLSAPSDQTTALGQKLREIVPILENLVATTTASLGPALLSALVPVVQLLGDLAGTSGPLNILVQSIGFAAGALHKLFEVSPGLQQMTVFSIGAYGALRAVMLIMTPFAAVARVLTLALIGEAAASNSAGLANLALRAQLIATAVAMRAQIVATKVMTIAQAALNLALRANPIGIVITVLAALAAGLVIAYTRSKTFRDIVNAVGTALRNGFLGAIRAVLGGLSSFLGAVASAARAVGADGLANKAQQGQRAIDDLRDSLRQVPARKDVDVAVKIKLDGQDIDVSKAKPLSPTPPGGDGPGVIGSRISDLVRSDSKVHAGIKALVADGLGSMVPGIGGAAGNLQGAKAIMRPFAAIGAQFGLHISPGGGKRPAGTRTSSGGVSLHSTGNAIDLANGRGPDQAKMQAFNSLRSRFGSRLAELIYTPAGGRQIKNGQNFLYTGSVARDHYDHVHVGFTGGPAATALGQAGNRGDGLGRFVGDGPGGGTFGATAAKIWASATGLMGSPGAMPPLVFTDRLGGGAAYAHFNSSNGRVAVTNAMLAAFKDPKNPNHNFALNALVHEFAHARQRADVSMGDRRATEGGAELFASWATPRIMAALGIPYSGAFPHAYGAERSWVSKNKGQKWWQRGQFSHTATAGVVGSAPAPGRLSGINLAIDAARRAGFKGEDLVRMVAIAGRESNYNPSAQNLKYPDHSIGLWQINQLAHKGRYGTDAQLKDPLTNARAAWAISGHGTNFGPWSTNAGLSSAALDQARAAIAAAGGGTSSGGRGGGGNAASGAASTVQKVNPLDQKLAQADLDIANTQAGKAFGMTFGSRPVRGVAAQVKAMTAKRKVIGTRIRALRKALAKKGLRPATKLRLTQELTQRLGEHAQLGKDIQELRHPAATDTGGGGGAGDVGGGFGGDGGDPNQALIDAINAAAEQQRKTEEATREHNELLAGLRAEVKHSNDIAARVAGTTTQQMGQALFDVLSGQIVGPGVTRRAFTPGSGAEYAY